MKKLLEAGFFDKEAVNTGRQIEVDFAKAFLILCLAYVHVTISCTPEEGLAHGLPFVFDSVIGGPFGAPMFMFTMGIGLVYTKHSTANDYISRGIMLFLLGHLLNFCRGTVPFVIDFLVTGDKSFLTDALYEFFDVDIMPFAGLAFILIGIFKKFNVRPGIIWLISLAMNIIAQFFNHLDFSNTALNIIGGYFIGIEDGKVYADFPLLFWMLLVASGYVFGIYLQHVTDKKAFYLRLSPVCLIISFIYYAVEIYHRAGQFAEGENIFYHYSTSDAVVSVIFALGTLGIWYAVSTCNLKKLNEAVTGLSKQINSYYCIHWVVMNMFIYVVLYLINKTTYVPFPFAILISTGVTLLTLFISNFWQKKIKPFWGKR